jgi:exodeoxyribonuclease V alpha subunit
MSKPARSFRSIFDVRFAPTAKPTLGVESSSAQRENSKTRMLQQEQVDPLAPGPNEHQLIFRAKKILHTKGDFHLVLGRATGQSRKDPTFADLDNFVVAGVFLSQPEEGLDYRIVGKFELYKGRRNFRARLASEVMARNAKGIAAWLRRQDIPGLGDVRIKRIAKAAAKMGGDALADMEFLQVCGINPDMAEQIAARWQLSGHEARAKSLLLSFGVRSSKITAMWIKYGATIMEIIRERPWEFCIAGFIGFAICDRIAINHGLSLAHPERDRAAVLESLRIAELEGHTAQEEAILLLRAGRLAEKEPGDLKPALDTLIERKTVIRVENGMLQLSERHEMECKVAEMLLLPRRRAVFSDQKQAMDFLLRAELNLGIRLDREGGQFDAALTALTSPLSVISGGPGTGKTTTQRVIVEALRMCNAKPLLLSPTGRAAKRLAEATSWPAHTIAKIHHKYRNGSMRMDSSVPIKSLSDDQKGSFRVDMAIVDESSMLCLDGTKNLVEFLPPECAVLFVGDIDQLPSVGAGAVLRDVMESGCCPVRYLATIHRQANNSDIPLGGRQVLAGQVPMSGRDLIIKDMQDDSLHDALMQEMKHLVSEKGFAPDDIQVLVPMKRGPLGAYALNAPLRQVINPEFCQNKDAMRSIGGFQFCVNDRVMNLKNDYSRAVMNGEIGRLIEFHDNDDETRIIVDFEGNKVSYSTKDDDIDDDFPLMPCYATTVHKAQGCEFDAVVIAIPKVHSRILTKNLIYTALTRAKKYCVILGDQSTIALGCRTNESVVRKTNLVSILHTYMKYNSKCDNEYQQNSFE